MSTNEIARLVLSVVIVFGFGGVLIAWMIWPPNEHSNVLSALVGALGAGYIQVINYWFTRAPTATEAKA
jgi:hypothetical protein